MKLSNFKATKEAVGFPLRHPFEQGEMLLNEDGKEVKLFLFGKASDAFQQLQDKVLKKMVDKVNAGNKGKKDDKLTPEQLKKDENETLVVVSSHIEGLEDDEGKPINTKEQFETIYSSPEFEWLRNQAKEFLEEDANFIKSAGKK